MIAILSSSLCDEESRDISPENVPAGRQSVGGFSSILSRSRFSPHVNSDKTRMAAMPGPTEFYWIEQIR